MPATDAATRRKRARGPRLTWITNRTVARHLKEADCNLVAVFADLATDKKVDAALRYRAADRLASLLFGPKGADRNDPAPAAPAVDVGAIIAQSWQKPDKP